VIYKEAKRESENTKNKEGKGQTSKDDDQNGKAGFKNNKEDRDAWELGRLFQKMVPFPSRLLREQKLFSSQTGGLSVRDRSCSAPGVLPASIACPTLRSSMKRKKMEWKSFVKVVRFVSRSPADGKRPCADGEDVVVWRNPYEVLWSRKLLAAAAVQPGAKFSEVEVICSFQSVLYGA
jgi:hypothetical protein